MRPAQYRLAREADGGNICNLTAQCGLYYLLVSTNGFDLSALVDTGATHSFISS